MEADFLDALLGYVCHDLAFCKAYGHLFTMEDFTNRAVINHAEREIVAGIILENWRRHKEPIGDQLRTAVQEAAKRHRLPDTRRAKLLGFAKRVHEGQRTAPDSLAERFLEFKRTSLLQQILDDTLERHTTGELTLEIFRQQVEKVSTLEAQLAPPSGTFDMAEELEARLSAREQHRKTKGFWTLIDGLDELMRQPPRKGYFCMALGLAKFGKSTFLSHVGLAGVIQGGRVLYLTLEDQKEICEARHDSIISGIPLDDLKNHTERVRNANRRFWGSVRGRLKIVDGVGSDWTSDDIDALILRERENGFDPDMVIVDYFLELEAIQKHKEFRWRSDEISRSLRKVAGKRNVLMWTAHQSAINADTMAAREMTMDKLAEDRGLARKVHLLIGFGQGDWDLGDVPTYVKCIHLYISASKFTPSNVGCNIVSDFSRAVFYDAEATARQVRREAIRQADEAGVAN